MEAIPLPGEAIVLLEAPSVDGAIAAASEEANRYRSANDEWRAAE